MKQLNTRFIISNLITAVLLFFSVNYYRQHYEYEREHGLSPLYSVLIIFAVLVGMVSMNVKSYDLAYHSKNKIQWHGRLFLFLMYLGGWISNMLVAGSAIPTEKNEISSFLGTLVILLFVIGFAAIVLESHFLSERPKKPLPVAWVKLAEKGSIIYSSVGIGLCWNHLVIGANIHIPNIFLSLVVHAVLMFFFVFSFQRLFWYEIISNSETKKDNLKTFLAILLVFLSGILPIYLA